MAGLLACHKYVNFESTTPPQAASVTLDPIFTCDQRTAGPNINVRWVCWQKTLHGVSNLPLRLGVHGVSKPALREGVEFLTGFENSA